MHIPPTLHSTIRSRLPVSTSSVYNSIRLHTEIDVDEGTSFFDGFDYFSGYDPTQGFVQ